MHTLNINHCFYELQSCDCFVLKDIGSFVCEMQKKLHMLLHINLSHKRASPVNVLRGTPGVQEYSQVCMLL